MHHQETEVLLNALAHTQAQMEPEKFADTVPYLEDIACPMRQLQADKLVDTLGDVSTKPLVDTLAGMEVGLEAETPYATLGYVDSKAPDDTLGDTF